jgi:glycosyltransferase involved in cell wall biosynthesis
VTAPAVSVVVPAHNAGRTISRTLRSILAQTLRDFEVVVVDDGSTDETATRVAELQEGDPRIRLVRQENRGAAAARNAGIVASSGRYTAFVDSDDLLLPRFLELSTKELDASPNAGIAFSDVWVFDDVIKRIHRATLFASQTPPLPLPADSLEVFRLLLRDNFIPSVITARLAALKHVGGYNESLVSTEDWELSLRIVAHGYGVVRLPRPAAIWRDRQGSMSSDRVRLQKGVLDVYRLVLAQYELEDDARRTAEQELAAAQARLTALRMQPPRSFVGKLLSGVKQRVLRRRRFHTRVPREIADAFPDLSAI